MHNRKGFQPPFSPTPPVYPFHDRQRRNRFLELVRNFLGRDGKEVTIENGIARVAGDPSLHGLGNLAQVCNQAPQVAWPEIVAEHLAKSDRTKLEHTVEGIADSEFEQVAAKLAVRIHPEGLLAGGQREHVVHRVDLPGTLSVLLLDIGESTLAVPKPFAERWGVPEPELFARALANLADNSRARWRPMTLPPSGVCTLDVLDGDFYATSHVLQHDPFLPRIGEHGNLIGLPTRTGLLSHPLDGPPNLRAIEELLMFTNWLFRDGPGSITPHLYWRTPNGQYLLQQGSDEGGTVRFAPSPEFVELMVRLRGTRGRSDEP